jgi:hypothetical protein
VNSVSVETIVAVAAAAVAALCLLASALILVRVRSRSHMLETEIERGKREFDAVVAHEVAVRTESSRRRSRACGRLALELAAEERRIADERRREVAERSATRRHGSGSN